MWKFGLGAGQCVKRRLVGLGGGGYVKGRLVGGAVKDLEFLTTTTVESLFIKHAANIPRLMSVKAASTAWAVGP